MVSTPQRTCVLCWGQNIWRTGIQDTALWHQGSPSQPGFPLPPLSALGLSTLPQQHTLICAHSLSACRATTISHTDGPQTDCVSLTYPGRIPEDYFYGSHYWIPFSSIQSFYRYPLFNTCVQYTFTVYFSGRVLYVGMHSLALLPYFFSGFSFLSFWKEKKDFTYPSKWKWIDGGYSNFVTPGSVPLRDKEAWNVLWGSETGYHCGQEHWKRSSMALHWASSMGLLSGTEE